MTAPLSNEALADLLAKAEVIRSGPRCSVTFETTPSHALEMAAYLTATRPPVVMALVREVQRLRSENASLRRDGAALSREIRASLVVAENNALRKNNERLTKENAELRERAKRAESANTTAQTMAAHWKLKATGEPLEDEHAAEECEKNAAHAMTVISDNARLRKAIDAAGHALDLGASGQAREVLAAAVRGEDSPDAFASRLGPWKPSAKEVPETEDTPCHCGRGTNGWEEPACDGCLRVPHLCRCSPLT